MQTCASHVARLQHPLLSPGLSLFRVRAICCHNNPLSHSRSLNTSFLSPLLLRGPCKVASVREKGWRVLVLLFSGRQVPDTVPWEGLGHRPTCSEWCCPQESRAGLPQSLRRLHPSSLSLAVLCRKETEEVRSSGKAAYGYFPAGNTSPAGDAVSESQDSVAHAARLQVSSSGPLPHQQATRKNPRIPLPPGKGHVTLCGHRSRGWQGGHRIPGESGLRKDTNAGPLRAAGSKWASLSENHLNGVVNSEKPRNTKISPSSQ